MDDDGDDDDDDGGVDTSTGIADFAASDPVTPVTVFYKRFQNKKENNRGRNSFEKKVTGVTGSLGGIQPGFGRLGVLDGPFFHILHRPPPSLPKVVAAIPHILFLSFIYLRSHFPSRNTENFQLLHNFYEWMTTATTAASTLPPRPSTSPVWLFKNSRTSVPRLKGVKGTTREIVCQNNKLSPDFESHLRGNYALQKK